VIDWALERDLHRSHDAAVTVRARTATLYRHTPMLAVTPARALKLETLQRSGSFKIRGAASALSAGARPTLVVAASTGNHGLAVATLAREQGLPCRIYVPVAAATAKLAMLRASGAELTAVDGDPLLAELAAKDAASGESGALLVPPYNDPEVILGQASVGLELLEDVPEPPGVLFVAAGGGGLISGVALAVRERWPRTTIVGCVPAASPAMADAVAAGRVVRSPHGPTLADATAGNIEDGSITVAIACALVDEFVRISEGELAAAMRLALLEHHLAIEGASALALAASLREEHPGRHLVVLGGGNVGQATLAAILDAGGPDHR
jgi:threonine dehydratase